MAQTAVLVQLLAPSAEFVCRAYTQLVKVSRGLVCFPNDLATGAGIVGWGRKSVRPRSRFADNWVHALPFFAKNLLIFAFVGPGRGVGYRCTGGAGPARRTAHKASIKIRRARFPSEAREGTMSFRKGGRLGLQKKRASPDPTKRCNHHRRIVAVCSPELGEFIQ